MIVDENKVVNYAGGIEKVICDFANEFVNRGYECTIVCMDEEHGKPVYALNNKVDFINLWYSYGKDNFGGISYFIRKIEKELLRSICGSGMRLFRKKIADPKQEYYNRNFIERLSNCISEKKPDCIVVISSDSAYLAQSAAGGSDIPIIGMCHMDPSRIIPYMSERSFEAWKKCTVLQAPLKKYVEDINKAGIGNVVHIPNPVAQICDGATADLSLPKNRIVTVGRIDGCVKRQHILIEAFAQLASKHTDWTVHIYGNIANKRYKQKLDKLVKNYHLEKKVIFEGVSQDINSCLRNSDIFAFPSEHEGFGLALAEAMAIGLPIVCYAGCGLAGEAIENEVNGMLAKEDSVEDFAAKLEQLMDNKELRVEIGRAARDSMRQYAAKNVWDKWEAVLNGNMNIS